MSVLGDFETIKDSAAKSIDQKGSLQWKETLKEAKNVIRTFLKRATTSGRFRSSWGISMFTPLEMTGL